MVRIKHRYLLINILYPETSPATSNSKDKRNLESLPYNVQFRQPCPDQMDGKLLVRLIRDGVADLFGDYGSGKIGSSLQLKYFSAATSTAIVRVSRDHYRLVWTALTYATQLTTKPANCPCVFQVVRVSGTIKKAEEEAIRRARMAIRKAQRPIGSVVPETSVSTPATEHIDNTDMLNGIEDHDEDGSDEG